MYKALVLILAIVQIAVSATIYDGLVNKKIERTIDLTSQIAKHTLTIDVTNSGSKSASEYFQAVPNTLAHKLAYIQAFEDSTALKVTKEKEETSYTLFRVELSKPLVSQASVTIIVKLFITHLMVPFPKAIAQDERQLVRYNANHFAFSPYVTTTQTTTVKLPSMFVESKSELAPTSLKGDMIIYGPYEDIQPYSVSPMSIHFENNKPFITATSLVKEIEISHWGNVAVEESYELLHEGAKLKGTFSRFQYQRTTQGKGSVVAAFKQILPEGAADVYYRDEIGNISTSHLFYGESAAPAFDVIPRYPLFGGWKIGFYLGYNLPATTYLASAVSESSRYVLSAPFATAFNDFVVDELTVRIIFPEGAKNIEYSVPFDVDGDSQSTHFTYLDTAGRPVLTITKKNVIPEHNQTFKVAYTFSQMSLLQEPILLIGSFFLFFLLFLVYSRLPFSIGSQVKTRNTPAEKAEGYLLKLKDYLDQRAELHSNLEAAISKYLKTKSSAGYLSEKKVAENALSAIAGEVISLTASLEDVAVELARKVRDLEKKEQKKVALQQQVHDNEINYKIKRSIQKEAYESVRDSLEKQLTTVDDEIEGFVADLTENL